MDKPVGLKTLAQELGLDVSTVSRALRDDPRVKPETRQALHDLAARHGYRPNVAARALKGGKTGRVAVLLSPPQQRLASPIFLELLSTLDQHLREKGLNLAVFAARDRNEETAIVRQIVEERLADGLVLGRTRRSDPRVHILLASGLPFVTFGMTEFPDRHPLVEIDYAEAGRIALRALAKTAAGPIDLLSGPEGLNFADHYVAGALEEAERLGCGPPRVWRVEMMEAAGEAVAGEVLETARVPAFACIQDSLAYGVLRAAACRNRDVGHHLTVFGARTSRDPSIPPLPFRPSRPKTGMLPNC